LLNHLLITHDTRLHKPNAYRETYWLRPRED